MSSATPVSALDVLGTSRNLELQNSILSNAVLVAFLENVEFMQNTLLSKMNDDRLKTQTLKDKLTLQQDFARKVKDPDKDDKAYTYILSFDPLKKEPFAGMEVVTGLTSFNQKMVDQIGIANPNYSFGDIQKLGGQVWQFPNQASSLSGKQLYAYYDQQAEATKSAISALNSVTSQDNLTLQSLRSKVDSNVQLMSTLIKNDHERRQGVMRNMQ
ncbi:MAG: hypothetical protein ACT6UH_17130 [Hydrogenophaga sp.]|uniref:hypothetical protein n=1 Tax=Hydrogenophaga sp. TaxID=1904254 RepID=UPI0040357847